MTGEFWGVKRPRGPPNCTWSAPRRLVDALWRTFSSNVVRKSVWTRFLFDLGSLGSWKSLILLRKNNDFHKIHIFGPKLVFLLFFVTFGRPRALLEPFWQPFGSNHAGSRLQGFQREANWEGTCWSKVQWKSQCKKQYRKSNENNENASEKGPKVNGQCI